MRRKLAQKPVFSPNSQSRYAERKSLRFDGLMRRIYFSTSAFMFTCCVLKYAQLYTHTAIEKTWINLIISMCILITISLLVLYIIKHFALIYRYFIFRAISKSRFIFVLIPAVILFSIVLLIAFAAGYENIIGSYLGGNGSILKLFGFYAIIPVFMTFYLFIHCYFLALWRGISMH